MVWDINTYRLCETFDLSYSNLPLLVVTNYSDLTPQVLRQSNPCFVDHVDRYQYEHLLRRC